MQIAQKLKKVTASFLLMVLASELLAPTAAFALTSGPSQPEMQSFEPVGTTDLVNAFSGDFVYNIPLLDVEGYPVNIAYHSGASVEDEASWVGLGWNINPGNISRAVRGIPDDFDGETITKQIKINPEIRKRFGAFFGLEVAGVGLDKAAKAVANMLKVNVGGSVNMGIAVSNYTGVSATLGLGSNLGLKNDWMSAGVNMGATFSTDQGVDLDASVAAGVSNSKASNALSGAVNGSFGKGFNSREGLKYTSFGVNPSFKFNEKSANAAFASKMASYLPAGVSNTMVPISMQNFVPVITNVAFTESNFFQLKVGIETTATIYPNFGGSYGEDKTSFEEDGSRKAYGYLNLEHANQQDITDFSRDRDGRFNRSMQYLPPGSLSYDIYAVNGQGTGGNFRAMRTDIGSVYDPYTTSESKAENNLVEIGAGNIFEAGWDKVNSFTTSTSGPWKERRKPFSTRRKGSLHEPVYFKQAGELSEASSVYQNEISGTSPLRVSRLNQIRSSPLESVAGQARVRRSNLLYAFNAEEAKDSNVSLEATIRNYTASGSMNYTTIDRVGGTRRKNQASEFTQLLPDGRRYIYGVPAMNNQQQEYVTSIAGGSLSNGNNIVNISGFEPYGSQGGGDAVLGQKFYMKTATPSYAHSYMLSSILSPDYSDLTGDGLSEDDIGSYTKFNYSRKESDYSWRTPYRPQTAQFNEGVASDCHDDKGTFVIGTKEIWMLHSIETKNYLALFYTTPRPDGLAATDALLPGSGAGKSYKLDSIILYNRQEFVAANGNPVVPVKKVVFTYDYSLCKGILNSTSPSVGKLTLRAITIKSGGSDLGYLSPYRFSYSAFNPNYSEDGKDEWGCYKAPNANGALTLGNHKFPYVVQDSVQATLSASAWNLTDISLPSGGAIHVVYESDDYAFVQDRRAMEMFRIEGVGPDEKFVQGTSLYQSQTNPYLYLYFKRKKRGSQYDEAYTDLLKTYLANNKILQYNVKVRISSQGERVASCANELEDYVKGYAAVESVGVCPESADYGYIKLSPKTVAKMPSLAKMPGANISLNPITLAAIFYARYYNNKALYPAGEIVSMNDPGAILKQLLSSFTDLSDYFRSPLAKYMNQGKAKEIDLNQSYVRLCSQGKKFGGGHRVKRIEFKDNWDAVSAAGQPVATYGSEYDYTVDDGTGRRISSGVASYEPLIGGDENPFKEPLQTEQIGQQRDFPVVLPTELITEGPIGETLFPSASVGYSKVTITSIHKAEGASSQTIQEKEFYTAKDFPVRVQNTGLEKIEDHPPKTFDFSLDKKEVFRAGQGYSLIFNDMHGKPSHERVLVQAGAGRPSEVSYKHYEYFKNPDGTLSNDVPCITAGGDYGLAPVVRTLGVETDIMLDSREKLERTSTTGFMANLNIFMGPGFPIPIPTAFPKMPKSNTKIFSSVVSTKVTQQYGILKSVETFDKGAKVKLSNQIFDGNTGQAIVTSVNTEHNDNEYQVKGPAYWAYRSMGPAYQNILYDEDLGSDAVIAGDTLYFQSANADRFQPGDELLLTVDNGCGFGNQAGTISYKMWVVGKPGYRPVKLEYPPCRCTPLTDSAVYYSAHHMCSYQFHKKDYVQFPAILNANGKVTDNICGMPVRDMLTDGSEGWNTLQAFAGSQGGGPMPQLADMLFGPNPYPVESIDFKYNGGDFPSNDLDTSAAPPVPLGEYPPLAGDTTKIWFQSQAGPWAHYNTKAPSLVYQGTLGNVNQYKQKYPGKPFITNANKFVKVTIHMASKRVLYLTDANGGNATEFLTIADFHKPSPPRNQWTCDYTLYFPYDKAYTNNLNDATIAALNRPETIWYRGGGNFTENNVTVWNPAYKPGVSPPGDYHIPIFNRLNPNNVSGYSHVRDSLNWYYWSTAEVITRSSLHGTKDLGNMIAAIPRKRNEVPHFNAPGPQFPKEASISKGSVKIIRSGFRNQLNEEIDQRTLLSKNGFTGYQYPTPSGASMLQDLVNLASSTYTDDAASSEAIADDATDYYNPYVTGMTGNPRILSKYNIKANRLYSMPTDPQNGLVTNVLAFWSGLAYGDPKYSWLKPAPSGAWAKDVTVKTYSPYGNDLEVEDAAGNLQAMLYGYGNSLPVASVKNSGWNNALFENFEDKGFAPTYLGFIQNPLKKAVLSGAAGITVTANAHHTGNYALQASGAVTIPFVTQNAVPLAYPSRALHPFYFRPGRKYILSYWQAVPQNTTSVAATGIVKITVGGIAQSAYAKTPVIDGWVLYEGEIGVPKLITSIGGVTATLTMSSGIIDDIRILPVESNMKCYVYNPVNRKLAASLDENHMASFFEYDAEGKLIRVKKETEKGILTLKESRSSVHSIQPGNGDKALTQ
jgi:hypothetical protein